MYIDDDLTAVFTPKSIGIRLILLRLRFLYEPVYYAAGVYSADEKKKGAPTQSIQTFTSCISNKFLSIASLQLKRFALFAIPGVIC